ncbi:MAG: hypothetical protein M3N41_14190 [Acidobacteriota bacterium]|nr:hypothetical protein [Acidobacteriota bacterium]
MLRFIAAVALFLVALPSHTQIVNAPMQTEGLNNGRLWATLPDASKTMYVAGAVDATIMACEKDEWKKLFAANLSVGEVLKSLNRFYDEPTNAPVPVTYAMTVVKMKAEGASADSIERTTANLRRLAAGATK